MLVHFSLAKVLWGFHCSPGQLSSLQGWYKYLSSCRLVISTCGFPATTLYCLETEVTYFCSQSIGQKESHDLTPTAREPGKCRGPHGIFDGLYYLFQIYRWQKNFLATKAMTVGHEPCRKQHRKSSEWRLWLETWRFLIFYSRHAWAIPPPLQSVEWMELDIQVGESTWFKWLAPCWAQPASLVTFPTFPRKFRSFYK